MKRVTVVFATILLVAVIALSLVACDPQAIDETLKDTVWPYSDTGEAEISLSFAAIKEAIKGEKATKGVFEWDIKITEDSQTKSYNYKLYIDHSATVKKTKMVIDYGQTVLASLSFVDEEGANETYFIDETTKTVMGTESEEFRTDIGLAGKYCIVWLVDEDDHLANWAFVAKDDDASINNKEGTSAMASIQYEYKSVRGDDTTMYINFQKVLTPMLVRLKYDFYEEENKVKEIEIYKTLHNEEPTEADFAKPTAENGYTIE